MVKSSIFTLGIIYVVHLENELDLIWSPLHVPLLPVQALWRGHRSRRLNEDLKVVKLRQRLRQLSADVREEDRLGNKTTSALDYLLRYKHFSYILEALKNLGGSGFQMKSLCIMERVSKSAPQHGAVRVWFSETATRLSPVCCERLVESGATVVIFTLIRSCNRSVPCMEVITFSIQILLNLSKVLTQNHTHTPVTASMGLKVKGARFTSLVLTIHKMYICKNTNKGTCDQMITVMCIFLIILISFLCQIILTPKCHWHL